MEITARSLTVQRLGRTVLHDVSLTLRPGERVCIIGPNGAGKSTLMAALLGLLPAAGGQVLLDGRPLGALPRRQIARRIAYLPQIHDAYLGFRVRDVVESGRYAWLDPLEPMSPQDREAVAAAVAACGIEPFLDRPLDTLSGGERQKVWLAAALAQSASVLFLDEPTNALDPAYHAELIRIMRRYAEGERTLLVISHDLNLPLVLGGRVVALKEGRMLFDEPAEVMKDLPRLERLFGTGFELHYDAQGRPVSVHVRGE